MNKLKYITVFACLIIGTFQVNAAVIDFTDGAGDGLTTFQQTLQGAGANTGAIATFSNPIVDAGTNDFFNLANGLALGTGGLGSSWQVSFDTTVELYSYTIDFSSGNKPFDIVGTGVNITGISNAAGTINLVTPIVFLAGEVYTFTLQPSMDSGGLTFLNWVFDAAASTPPTQIPVLSSWSLSLLFILLGMIAIKSRRKAKA